MGSILDANYSPALSITYRFVQSLVLLAPHLMYNSKCPASVRRPPVVYDICTKRIGRNPRCGR